MANYICMSVCRGAKIICFVNMEIEDNEVVSSLVARVLAYISTCRVSTPDSGISNITIFEKHIPLEISSPQSSGKSSESK